MSAGLAVYRVGEAVEDTISRADLAMLDAKRGGRGTCGLPAEVFWLNAGRNCQLSR